MFTIQSPRQLMSILSSTLRRTVSHHDQLILQAFSKPFRAVTFFLMYRRKTRLVAWLVNIVLQNDISDSLILRTSNFRQSHGINIRWLYKSTFRVFVQNQNLVYTKELSLLKRSAPNVCNNLVTKHFIYSKDQQCSKLSMKRVSTYVSSTYSLLVHGTELRLFSATSACSSQLRKHQDDLIYSI